MTNKYTEFIQEGEIYKIRNIIYDQIVGEIREERMGTWMHWGLTLTPEFMKQLVEGNHQLFFSNGCLKEISEFITSLYRKDRKENAIRRSQSKKGS